MGKFGLGVSLAAIAGMGAVALHLTPAKALEPGVFTQCVASNAGIKYAVLASSRDRCFQMARECSGNPNVSVTWYSSAVYVETPYTECRSR